MTDPKSEFRVVRNHDYTVSLFDQKNRELAFRDIKGSDLELLDQLFDKEEGKEEEEGEAAITFEAVLTILDLLCVRSVRFQSLPQRIIAAIFEIIREHILCNYMTKMTWLGACYGIQNGSFVNVLDMEQVPMTKFMAMTQIHQQAIESIKNSQNE
jgi:hypothetical protein